jgi:hypothetical protein
MTGGGIFGTVVATERAVVDVLQRLEETQTDPTTGQLRVTYDENPAFTVTSVLAEWRPSK